MLSLGMSFRAIPVLWFPGRAGSVPGGCGWGGGRRCGGES